MERIMETRKNRIETNPTKEPVNGKLQLVIMWSQIAEILGRGDRFDIPLHLRDEINSIESIDLLPFSLQKQSERKILIDEMNA